MTVENLATDIRRRLEEKKVPKKIFDRLPDSEIIRGITHCSYCGAPRWPDPEIVIASVKTIAEFEAKAEIAQKQHICLEKQLN